MRLGSKNHRRNPEGCGHAKTVSVIHAGLERMICDTCGQIRIEYRSDAVSADPGRESFARQVERVAL